MRTRYLYGLLFIISIVSCEINKEIDFEGIPNSDKIVIRGYLNSAFGVQATVTKSLPVNNPTGNNYLTAPKVWLFENDQPLTQLIETDSSQFITPDTLTLNKESTYKLVVEAYSFETAISNTEKLLPPVQIDSIYWAYDTINWVGNFYVSFTDPTPETNDKYLVYCVLYIQGNSHPKNISDNLYDNGFATTEKIFADNYLGRLDSAMVSIYYYSPTIVAFNQSWSDYESSYSDIMFDDIFQVKNYIENGYGYFGAMEITQKMFYRN